MKPHILIVVSNYYNKIALDLLSGAELTFKAYKAPCVSITVPGVFEIPTVISRNIKKYDGFIALGCVIKGETPHFDYISKTTFEGLMKLSIENKKPIGNGIITALNKDQARARCGSYDVKDHIKNGKGEEAANAVIAVLSK